MRSLSLNIFIIIFLSGTCTIFAQSVGVSYITIQFEQPPTTYSVTKTALRYNKDFALGIHLDDGKKDIYTHAYPLLMGGIVEGIPYPGLFYTDGCGNDINFKMSSSIFSFFQNGTVDGHDPNGPYGSINVTWPELIEMYQNGWGVYNHGLTSSASSDYYYEIRRNHSYVKRMMLAATPGGPEMKVFVNPNGNENYTTPAFGQEYIVAYRQYSFGVPSFDVTQHTFEDTLKMGRTSLEGGVSLNTIANNMAAASVNGAHHFGATFSHSVTGGQGYSFPTFRAYMNYIEDFYGKDGADNIWLTTEEEILEYLMVNDAITVNDQLIYTDLIITFDGTLRTDLRYYATTLLIEADVAIDTIIIVGGTNNTFNGMGTNTTLINLEWDGYVRVPDSVNADYYVSIAEQTQFQHDWNIAMDYVEIIPPGDLKEYFRDRLCAIQGVIPPEGYCNCQTTCGPDTTICQGECVTLIAGEGISWEWNTGDTTQTIYVCPDTTTMYSVEVYNLVGCPSSDSATVTISYPPAGDAGNDTTICSGTCATLIATGGDHYEWSTGDTTDTITVCPLDTTTYEVTIFNEFDCFSEDSVTVNVVPSPIAHAGNDTAICLDDCVILTASGGISYIWSTGDTTASITVCPVDSTVYSVTTFGENGCFDSDTVEVFVYPLPVPEAGNDTSTCRGVPVILTASGGVSYQWSTGDTSQSIVVSPNDTTTYFVSVFNEYDCSAEDSVTVNIIRSPDPTINSGNDTTICEGDCVELHVDSTQTIMWSTGDTVPTIIVCPDTATMYYVLTINDNDCAGVDSLLVSIQEPPVPHVGPDTMICEGNCTTLEASGGAKYLWDHGDTTSSIEVCPDTTTRYYVTVFDSIGCFSRDSAIVTVNPHADIIITPDTGVCLEGCIDLSASGGTSYLWSTGQDTSDITVCPEDPKMYYVEVNNQYDCPAYDSVFVDVYTDPDPDLRNDTVICRYDCIELTAYNGVEFYWSTGDTTQTIQVCPSEVTKYYVDVTDIHGCMGFDSVRIDVMQVTPAEILNLQPVFCSNDDSVRLEAYPGPGEFSGPGVNLWEGIYYFVPTMAPLDSSEILYYYLNDNDCYSYDTAIVTVFPLPEVNLGIDTIVCNNIYLTLDAGPDKDSYLWPDGSMEQTWTFLPGDLGLGFQEVEVIVTKSGCVGFGKRLLNVIVCNPGIDEYGNVPDIIIYPNPAKDKLNVEIYEYIGNIHYEITDMIGRRMITGEIISCSEKECSRKLDTSILYQGLYSLIIIGDDFVVNTKFVISK